VLRRRAPLLEREVTGRRAAAPRTARRALAARRAARPTASSSAPSALRQDRSRSFSAGAFDGRRRGAVRHSCRTFERAIANATFLREARRSHFDEDTGLPNAPISPADREEAARAGTRDGAFAWRWCASNFAELEAAATR